jgi:membrane dipeptidase
VRKWILTGLAAIVAVIAIRATYVLMAAPAEIDRHQNRVVALPLHITPDAQAPQKTLDVADMHADSLLWKRDILERSDRGHVDVPRLIEGHYALQVFSSVTKSPKGQNFNANGADTDTITNLAMIQHVRVRDVALTLPARGFDSDHEGDTGKDRYDYSK